MSAETDEEAEKRDALDQEAMIEADLDAIRNTLSY